jgi:hypothetical protein
MTLEQKWELIIKPLHDKKKALQEELSAIVKVSHIGDWDENMKKVDAVHKKIQALTHQRGSRKGQWKF